MCQHCYDFRLCQIRLSRQRCISCKSNIQLYLRKCQVVNFLIELVHRQIWHKNKDLLLQIMLHCLCKIHSTCQQRFGWHVGNNPAKPGGSTMELHTFNIIYPYQYWYRQDESFKYTKKNLQIFQNSGRIYLYKVA